MVVLGFLSAISEGIGLSLFIPLFYSLGGESVPAMPAAFLTHIGDVFGEVDPSHRMGVIAACIVGLVVLKNALQFVNKILQAWLEARLVRTFRSHVVASYLLAPWKQMQATDMGTHVNTLEWVTRDMASAVMMAVACVIYAATIVVLAGFLLLISWPLMLFVTTVLTAISVIIYFLTRRVKQVADDAVRADEVFGQGVLQMLAGMRTIRLFNLEGREQERLERSADEVARLFVTRRSISALINPVSELLVAVLIMAVLFTVTTGANTLPALLTFIFILYRMHPPIKMLDEARTEVLAYLPSIETVLTALDEGGPEKLPVSVIPQNRASAPTIEFCDVRFHYDEDEPPVLDGATLRIEPNSVTAVVGRSGSGKSTLIHLLTRFYTPQSGRILIDGEPLAAVPAAEWRRRIGLVAHDAHLFNTSILENIRCGRLDASLEEVIDASRMAYAHDFISELPDAYETNVDELGARLSAGQRQRIALARAILRDPTLLILDEATNALDSISDDFVRRSLRHLRGDRTIILIAHRLSTIRHADHILVVDDGRVAESGTFSELMARGGLFEELFASQHFAHTARTLARAS